MFSTEHFYAIAILILSLMCLYIFKKNLTNKKLFERILAISLLTMEIAYHIVLILSNDWTLSESLPIHLCSFSLFFSIVTLWTGNTRFYPFIFYAGVSGAIQAVLTPSTTVNYPHFLFIQFFYIHIGIIFTGFYILWVKGYKPTFKGIIHTLILLNILALFAFIVNTFVEGNYMFLNEKPFNGSLLDFLGPFPWYILSLEVVAFILFVAQWLVFRKWEPSKS